MWYRPQLAQLARTVPSGDEWLHEIKYDGYRIGCLIDQGRVTLASRNGRDWTAAFPEICEAVRQLPARHAVIDGEVVILLPDGRTSFQALQQALGGGPRAGLVYFAFDLLAVNGEDLVGQPLEERKARLHGLLERSAHARRARRPTARPSARRAAARTADAAGLETAVPADRIRYSEHVAGSGALVFREACRLGLEGIVSKRRAAPHRDGRTADWLKTKCVSRQEFVIGGFTDPEGSRSGIGALVIGYHDATGRLVFAGKVGTGFTQKAADALRARLEALDRPSCPFDPPPSGALARTAHWVEPTLVAEVTFTEWTADGHLRHPSFQGLREDRDPRAVTRDQPIEPNNSGTGVMEPNTSGTGPVETRAAPGGPAGRVSFRNDGAAEVRGVRLTNPDRLLYPDIGLTKLDLARYYDSVADWILPHVLGRPLTIVRCPKGLDAGCFYMKHSATRPPAGLRRIEVRERKGTSEYLVADSPEAVIGLAQMSVLEIHTWNSLETDVERPDRLVFDLDPGGQVGWPEVVSAARLVRSALEALDLASYVKTTGGAGLHVVVPLVPVHDWDRCLAFARGLADRLARFDSARFTTSFSKAARKQKILVDYLRNARTNTSVAAYSSRARAGAPVSVPLAWSELSPQRLPADFTVRTVPRRLARLKKDPWEDYWRRPQRVSRGAMRAMAELE